MPETNGLLRRALPAERGEDLLDVRHVLVLVLEEPPHAPWQYWQPRACQDEPRLH